MNSDEKIQLFQDVFAPKPKEKIIFIIDTPHGTIKDNEIWKDRRNMAHEWIDLFKQMGTKTGFSVSWLLYKATGLHNALIRPEILNVLRNYNIIIAMTEFSATSSLKPICKTQGTKTRCASLPGVERRMEQTAFKANYQKVKQYAIVIAQMLNNALRAEIVFSTGDQLNIDLRHRLANADTGECTQPGQTINFPSGEACQAPYEAAEDEISEMGVSQTEGILPVNIHGEHMKFVVKNNTIIDILGRGKKTDDMRMFFAQNDSRRNIAELGIGCNPNAVVTGNVLEDEKVGLHIAYGMSNHLGGKIQSDMHQDICYSKGCPVEGTRVVFINADGSNTEIIRHSQLQYSLLEKP
jgi:hypothetical protein